MACNVIGFAYGTQFWDWTMCCWGLHVDCMITSQALSCIDSDEDARHLNAKTRTLQKCS